MLLRLVVGYERLVGRWRRHIRLSLVESLPNLHLRLHLVVGERHELRFNFLVFIQVWNFDLRNAVLGFIHRFRLCLYESLPADTYLRGQLLRKLLVVLGAGGLRCWFNFLVLIQVWNFDLRNAVLGFIQAIYMSIACGVAACGDLVGQVRAWAKAAA